MRKEELQKEIESLENQLKPLKEEMRDIYTNESNECKEKLARCHQQKDKFELEELMFSATSRCVCGAGLCYPLNTGMHGEWDCSDILLGRAQKGSSHDGVKPFSMWSVKSEGQPSANMATTRPEK